jgi:hypothetical protein
MLTGLPGFRVMFWYWAQLKLLFHSQAGLVLIVLWTSPLVRCTGRCCYTAVAVDMSRTGLELQGPLLSRTWLVSAAHATVTGTHTWCSCLDSSVQPTSSICVLLLVTCFRGRGSLCVRPYLC